jgi:hypothetical protein
MGVFNLTGQINQKQRGAPSGPANTELIVIKASDIKASDLLNTKNVVAESVENDENPTESVKDRSDTEGSDQLEARLDKVHVRVSISSSDSDTEKDNLLSATGHKLSTDPDGEDSGSLLEAVTKQLDRKFPDDPDGDGGFM